MSINKSGIGAAELEPAAGKLLLSKFREFLDQRVFPPHDFAKVETHFRRVDAPDSRVVGQVQDFGGVEQGFCRHATAQNTKSADLLAAFDNDSLKACISSGPRRRVTGAAAANNREVKFEVSSPFSHDFRMSRLAGAGKT